MASQVRLRSQGPPPGTELLAEVTAIDRPKLIKLIEDSNKHDLADPCTPKRLEYFQTHRHLCTALGHPIYSTAAIFKICHEIQPHNYPELLAPIPDPIETGQPARLSEIQAASGTVIPALPRLIHFRALTLDIPVDGESFEEIFQELTEQLGAETSVIHDQFPHIEASWDEYVSLLQFALNSAQVARHGMSSLFSFFWQTTSVAGHCGAARHLDPLTLEFVTSFQTRLQEALDVGRLGQVKLIERLDATCHPTKQLRVGD